LDLLISNILAEAHNPQFRLKKMPERLHKEHLSINLIMHLEEKSIYVKPASNLLCLKLHRATHKKAAASFGISRSLDFIHLDPSYHRKITHNNKINSLSTQGI